MAQTLTGAGLELVGEAASTKEAIEVVVDVRADVVLVDIRLPDSPRVQAIERLSVFAPASRILILTHSEEDRVVEAVIAGASGYILKTAPPKAIVAAVRATEAGGAVLCPEIAGRLLRRTREQEMPGTTTATSQDAASAIRAALSERELEIFERLASGNSNHDIARELSLGTNTVHNHIASILAKLPPREPHPSIRPSSPQRHLLAAHRQRRPRIPVSNATRTRHVSASRSLGEPGGRRSTDSSASHPYPPHSSHRD